MEKQYHIDSQYLILEEHYNELIEIDNQLAKIPSHSPIRIQHHIDRAIQNYLEHVKNLMQRDEKVNRILNAAYGEDLKEELIQRLKHQLIKDIKGVTD